jgi:hypothetical protein
MKTLSAKLLTFLVAPIIILSFTSMPERASLAGEWKLNEGKSELGEFGGRFAARKINIEQKADAITISKTAPSFDGGDVTTTETLSFDGKELESTVFGSSKKKSVAKWSDDGQLLTITYTIAFERDGQTTEIKGKEAWTLTKDGTLSLITESTSPFGDITTKAVYDK